MGFPNNVVLTCLIILQLGGGLNGDILERDAKVNVHVVESGLS